MIDFHVHSTASDGTVMPKILANNAREFYAIALTDHDNTDGVKEFRRKWKGAGRFLAGVELSVQPGEGYGQFHLLGLGIDEDNEEFKKLLAEILVGRNERNKQIIAKLNELGVDVTEEEARRFAKGEILARPHIARAICAKHFAHDMTMAFKKYLATDAPAYVSRWRPEPQHAIAAIHAAGGLAIMAHPRYWTDDEALLMSGLKRLKDQAGLDGIEAVYQANLPEHTIMAWRAAEALDLVKTAGSDFHGHNKPHIALGMAMVDEVKFLEPFFERLEGKK